MHLPSGLTNRRSPAFDTARGRVPEGLLRRFVGDPGGWGDLRHLSAATMTAVAKPGTLVLPGRDLWKA